MDVETRLLLDAGAMEIERLRLRNEVLEAESNVLAIIFRGAALNCEPQRFGASEDVAAKMRRKAAEVILDSNT